MARHVPDGAHVLSVGRPHRDSPRKLVLAHAGVLSQAAAFVAALARIGEAIPDVGKAPTDGTTTTTITPTPLPAARVVASVPATMA